MLNRGLRLAGLAGLIRVASLIVPLGLGSSEGSTASGPFVLDSPGQPTAEWVGLGAGLPVRRDLTIQPAPPMPLEPVAHAQIPQNDASTGCTLLPARPKRGHGFKIVFDWTDVPGATQYRLVAKLFYARDPIVDLVVSESTYTYLACNLFTVGTLTGWQWQVQSLADGVAGELSAPSPFSFYSCRLPDGSLCSRDPGPYPAPVSILIDASRDGGGWWLPQSLTTGFDPAAAHRGKALADYLRRRGYVVDEMPQGASITRSTFDGYAAVIRANAASTPYTRDELAAYEVFLSRAGTLWLVSDQNPVDDALAASLGVSWSAAQNGTVATFAPHAITKGVTNVNVVGGSVLKSMPPSITALGSLNGLAILGVVPHETARIFFIGDLDALESVPQPLVNNLIAWGF